MADANGIIFKNPTLNTWFVAPSVDLTAWSVITVSDCPDTEFNLDYTYVPATGKWTNGTRSIWKDTLWYMSDGTIVYTAPDNGLNTPPSTFTRTLDYPLTITVSGAGKTEVNGTYTYTELPPFGDGTPRGWAWITDGVWPEVNEINTANGRWYINYPATASGYYYTEVVGGAYPPKNGFICYISEISGLPIFDPAPTLEYSLEVTAAISSSSTATWASNSPTSGFVSLTDTSDEDFGYVITFDVQGGAAYPYYKYCTKTAGEVYGAMPSATRSGYYFAGWYTATGGQGSRATDVTPLIESANHTLYAKWIPIWLGAVLFGRLYKTQFLLGVGSDVFLETTLEGI
jgi:uncharacterized repeat protein (TIGR02543 family)